MERENKKKLHFQLKCKAWSVSRQRKACGLSEGGLSTFCLRTHRKRLPCNQQRPRGRKGPYNMYPQLCDEALQPNGFQVIFPAQVSPILQMRQLRKRKNRHRVSCHLCNLEFVFGGPKEPWSWSPTTGHDIGIQVTLGKWPQAIPKGTVTHHRLLALRNSYFSFLPTICSQVAGSLSSPQLDMWIPDVHGIASSCVFASCGRYRMSVATHLTSGEHIPQQKKHLAQYWDQVAIWVTVSVPSKFTKSLSKS